MRLTGGLGGGGKSRGLQLTGSRSVLDTVGGIGAEVEDLEDPRSRSM